MGNPLLTLIISSRSINKYGRQRQFLFLIGRFLTIFSSEIALPNELKLGTDPGSFKLTDMSYRLRFSLVSLACIVPSFFVFRSFEFH
jgi:hypothetical protein